MRIVSLFFILLISSCVTRKTTVLPQLSDSDLEEVPKDFQIKNLKVLVINMDDEKSKKRYERMLVKLAEYPDLKPTRFPAVNGRVWKDKYKPTTEGIQILDEAKGYKYAYKPDILRRGLKAGELGNYFSHYEAIKVAKANTDGVTLILEDDAAFVPHLSKRFLSAMANLPKNWDILYLHCFSESQELCKTKNMPIVHQRFFDLEKADCVAGLAAYVLNPTGADKILKTMIPASNTSDDRMERLYGQEEGPFHAYCTLPQIAAQEDAGSLIDSIDNRW